MIQIKNAAELQKMRKACAISAAALKAGGEAIEPGITTAEIDKIIYDFIVRHGARPNFLHLYGFPATACISVNDTVIHGIPTRQQQIRPGDIVSIDTGCKIDGFNGDNACTYGCGKLDLEAQRLLDVTKESLHRGIEMARGGNRVGDIGHAVQSYVEENGFSVVRSFVGHGVGKELHEDPEVPNFGNAGRGPRLVPGMCIAVEPMVCQYKYAVKTLKDGWTVKTCDGGLAAHFEAYHGDHYGRCRGPDLRLGGTRMDFVRGQLVRSKAGRDKTRTLAVLAVDGPTLLVADGDLRKLDNPKRKKMQHVAPTTTVLENELLKSDQQLRDAIRAYDAARN